MNLLVEWLIFPLLLAAVAIGLALLAERVGGFRLPGALLLPFGLALAVVAIHIVTISDSTAELAAPLVLGLACAGTIVSPPWRRGRPDPWIAGAALVVYLCFAAPVVFSGDPTFTGFVKLDDTATWLGQVDRLMDHGRSLDGLAPSTYEAALEQYLPRGAPVGAMFPLGLGSVLLAADPAWLFAPCLAFVAAMLALALSEVTRPLVQRARSRAVVAAVAAQPALLVAYVMWGGIKEMAAAFALALIAATLPLAIAPRPPVSVVPVAVAAAALLAILGPAGGIWLAPLMFLALVVALNRIGMRTAVGRAVGFLLVTAALSVPLLTGNTFSAATGAVLYAESELGNLFGPLDPIQALGIWPTGEFRGDHRGGLAGDLLIIVALLAAIAGAVLAVRRRTSELLLLPMAGVISACAIVAAGSPWVDAKGLAILSPALLAAAMVGAVSLARGRWRALGVTAAALIAVGVAWSNVLTYGEVNIAPYDELRELERIGEDIAGEGPTLMTNYMPYGPRHFLREGDPEGASELRRRPIPTLDGGEVFKGNSADTDELDLGALLVYRTLVLRRSPDQSRPPSPYSLVAAHRYYEVWQRPIVTTTPAERIPLGSGPHPAEAWDCQELARLRAAAGEGTLLYVERPTNVVFSLAEFDHPGSWTRPGSDVVFPDGQGYASLTISLPGPGTWRAWIGGTWRGDLELWIDGERVESSRHSFNYFQYADFGEVELGAEAHEVELRYSGADFHPGSAGSPEPTGPLVFSRSGDEPNEVKAISADRARALCGKRLDWLEVVPG